jgi:hypothetical protein
MGGDDDYLAVGRAISGAGCGTGGIGRSGDLGGDAGVGGFLRPEWRHAFDER